MLEETTNDRTKFFVFGFVMSLALHAACGVPFLMSDWDSRSDEPEPLVIELQGIVADTQVEHQTMQAIKGDAEKRDEKEADKPPQQAVPPQDAPDVPPQETVEPEKQVQPPQQASSSSSSSTAASEAGDASPNTIVGKQVQQNAQTIQAKQDENERIRDYVRRLGKKVQSSLPAEKRRASVTISFEIQSDGQVRRGTLKIVQSSGQPALDESASNTVLANSPFTPPPRAITVQMTVDFDRRR
jgi:TonB family protein